MLFMSTLLERLEVAEAAAVGKKGQPFKSLTAWCNAAGLSKSFVGGLKKRLAENPEADAGSQNLAALCVAAGLDPSVLLGDPDEGEGPANDDGRDPYSSRPPVVAILRARGAPRGVIDALMSLRFKEGDPGRERWIELAEELIRDDQTIAKMLGLGEEDERLD